MAVNELRFQNGLLRDACEGRRSPGLMDASDLLFQNGLLRDVIFFILEIKNLALYSTGCGAVVISGAKLFIFKIKDHATQ